MWGALGVGDSFLAATPCLGLFFLLLDLSTSTGTTIHSDLLLDVLFLPVIGSLPWWFSLSSPIWYSRQPFSLAVLCEVYYSLPPSCSRLLPLSRFTSGFITMGRASSLMDKSALAQLLHENISWIPEERWPGSWKAEALSWCPSEDLWKLPDVGRMSAQNWLLSKCCQVGLTKSPVALENVGCYSSADDSTNTKH